MNTKLHAVTDSMGRPIRLFLSAGPSSAVHASPARQRVSDYVGARALCGSLPTVEWLIGESPLERHRSERQWRRLSRRLVPRSLAGQRDTTLHSRQDVPGRAIRHDKRGYKRRNRMEIMFGRLKDRRRIATRYDRCQEVFLSAIARAAAVIFWL